MSEKTEARVVWDFTIAEPDKFVMRLEDVRETMNTLEARGMKTRFAMIVRGPASKLVTKAPPTQPTPELDRAARRIAPLLQELSGRGVVVEQCGVALGRQGVSRENLLPLVSVIHNSYVSIVDYEMQGYAYVPMD
jgi:intracellular sulfur oxidation DsrE/DsrF family protein